MEDKKRSDSYKCASRDNSITNKKIRQKISKRESVFLTVSDILVFATILLNISYLGNITKLNRWLLLAINIIMVILSYLTYQLKRIIRKRIFRYK